PLHSFSLMLRPPLSSTLFPYTTLFRSGAGSHAACAFNSHASGHMLWNTTDLYGLNSASPSGFTFGWCANTTADDTGNTVSVNMTDRKSTRLNSSHVKISYAVFCLKKKN